MTSNKLKLRKGAVLSVVAACVLAACGGDDDDANVTTTTAAAAAPTTEAEAPATTDAGEAPATTEAEAAPETTVFEGEPIDVTMVIPGPGPDPITAWVNVAAEGGFMEAAGVNLELQYVQGGVAAATALAAGQVDIASVAGDTLMQANATGADIRTFLQVGYSPGSVWGFIEGSEYQDIASLEGAKIGIASVASTSEFLLRASLAAAGVDPDSVELVPTGFGPTSVAAAQSGEIDAGFYSPSVFDLMIAQGINVNVVPVEAFVGNWSGSGLAASRASVEAGDEKLVRFAKGALAAIEFCVEDPDGCIEKFQEAHPDAVSDVDLARAQWVSFSQALIPPAGVTRGQIDLAGWQTTLDMLVENGLIEDGAIVLEDQFTDAFFPG